MRLLTHLSHEQSISVDNAKPLIGTDWENILCLLKAKGAITVSKDMIRPGSGKPMVEDHELFKICKSCKCDCTYKQADLDNLKDAEGWGKTRKSSASIDIIKDYYKSLGINYRFNKTEIVVISNMIKEYSEPAVREYIDWLSKTKRIPSLITAPYYYLEYKKIKC